MLVESKLFKRETFGSLLSLLKLENIVKLLKGKICD